MSSAANPLLRATRDELLRRVVGDAQWDTLVRRTFETEEPVRAHLAVMHEPYLGLVVAGRKTVESRFGRVHAPPYREVGAGDLVLLKQVAGPVTALVEVRHADFYVLDPARWEVLQRRFAPVLCAADREFWAQRRDARYATLMRLGGVRAIDPLHVDKRDRRAWVVLDEAARTGVHREQQAFGGGAWEDLFAVRGVWTERVASSTEPEVANGQLRFEMGGDE